MEQFKLSVLTPVHIGSGEETVQGEYLIKDTKYHKIDLRSLFGDPRFDRKQFCKDLLNSAKSNEKENKPVSPYLGDIVPQDKHDLLKEHSSYELDLAWPPAFTNKSPIKDFIKTGLGVPYIPGSSIKGAVLSAMYWHFLKESDRCKGYSRFDDFSKELFEDMGGRSKFMPWLQVSDTATLTFDALAAIKCERMSEKPTNIKGSYLALTGSGPRVSKRPSIPTFCEALKLGTSAEFSMKPQRLEMKTDEILNIVNAFYSNVLKEEKAWCERAGVDTTFYSEIDKKNVKMKLGWGSSALALSLWLLAKEIGMEKEYEKNYSRPGRPPKNIFPKTHFIATGVGGKQMPLGWVGIEKV